MDICDVCTIDADAIIRPKIVNGRLLYCTCPFCGKKVGADIYQGKITCPACYKTATWNQD